MVRAMSEDPGERISPSAEAAIIVAVEMCHATAVSCAIVYLWTLSHGGMGVTFAILITSFLFREIVDFAGHMYWWWKSTSEEFVDYINDQHGTRRRLRRWTDE